MKKFLGLFILLVLALGLFACELNTGTNTNSGTNTDSEGSKDDGSGSTSDAEIDTTQDDDAFGNSDTKDVSGEESNATINLTNGTLSDTTRGSVENNTITITSKGIYYVTGTTSTYAIVVNDTTESGNIYLVLDNVSMTLNNNVPIYVKAADKVIIQAVNTNTLTSTMTSAKTDDSTSIDGTIFANCDLTINGTGSLAVNSKLHGIVCKKDLKITSGNISVTATEKGIDFNKSFSYKDATLSITSGHDGIHGERSKNDPYFYMESGSITIVAAYDGIDVSQSDSSTTAFTGYVKVVGGTLNITAGGGSNKSSSSSQSTKGIKSTGEVAVGGGEITISSSDDALHSNSTVTIDGGTINVSSSDDGIHADKYLTISNGTVTVSKSYEGLEAENVIISGGTISITSSDDGINAAGGSDSGSGNTFNPWAGSSSTGTLRITGGNLYVNASGDGLDSNGSLYVSGGYIIVEGPTNSGNGALDKGDGNNAVCEITGGTILAIGSTGMAVNFSSGTQCSMLVSLSGNNGTKITVDDGSGFEFTASKSFGCIVYSSPNLTKGSTYKVTAGSNSTSVTFSSMYYSNVSGMGGGGFPGGGGGRHW